MANESLCTKNATAAAWFCQEMQPAGSDPRESGPAGYLEFGHSQISAMLIAADCVAQGGTATVITTRPYPLAERLEIAREVLRFHPDRGDTLVAFIGLDIRPAQQKGGASIARMIRKSIARRRLHRVCVWPINELVPELSPGQAVGFLSSSVFGYQSVLPALYIKMATPAGEVLP